MEPAVLIAIGGVLVVAVVATIAFRRRSDVHSGGDSDEEEDNELALRVAGETAALMDEETDDSLPKPLRRNSSQETTSALVLLQALFGRGKRPVAAKSPIMHRRNKGVKKIHKPYFYPLLDETAQWFAEWESKKQQQDAVPVAEIVEVRIDKPKSDLLADGLDCVPLVSFRSSSHTVLPVAAI